MRPGADGRARILVKGKGPGLGFSGPLDVQIPTVVQRSSLQFKTLPVEYGFMPSHTIPAISSVCRRVESNGASEYRMRSGAKWWRRLGWMSTFAAFWG